MPWSLVLRQASHFMVNRRSAATDVALIDLEMPDTDGLALATEIRESGGSKTSARLILISAAENQTTGQGWPFDGFLQKPIAGPDVARIVGTCRQPQST